MNELRIINKQKNFSKKKTLLWNQKSERKKNILNIFDLINDNKYVIREKYLHWIYQFQNQNINKEKIISHLKINNDFSFWWMLPISEKSNFMKSFHINEILKLIALEQYIKKNKFKKIFTIVLNKKTNDVISIISKKNKIIIIKHKIRS